ncbi:MAG: malto-oligosyltrehalose trehalohydrolase [Alphaproteobacteria bacterium]|nr:malto-oligosyltrehalose trehalohydrolase [Alphaproteobacteria bacterium]
MAYQEKYTDPKQRVGANFVPGQGTYIKLWAPKAQQVSIAWEGGDEAPLAAEEDGYFTGHFPQSQPGSRYRFILDGKTRLADPASRFQPLDTDGSSEVVADDFAWHDATWQSVPFNTWVIYELHAGTYSPSHDFDGIIADLPRLKDLGITTIELMPVSQFSGARNWGYDGVFPHAVQHSYGGPQKLKALVDACHAQGLAIILDVVYNHLGPEGNVLFQCAPYATEKYNVPWGEALNFDGEENHHVRHYFLQSAWQWLVEYHFDGLRLDAVQMIFDNTPIPFMQELYQLKCEAEKIRGCPLVLIGESDMNDARILMPPEQNGFGLEAHWADDFHHAIHATLTGEQDGYYADYGGVEQLARIYERGVAFEGEYSPFRKRPHGRSYAGIDKKKLVVETQNHDQTGNRLKGERLIGLVGFEKAKLGAAAVLLSPFTPFLFMGEELANEQPFLYFISHHDQELIAKSRESRAEEWKSFGWKEEPPDPGDEQTFLQSVLQDKNPAAGSKAAAMRDYYKALIALSKEVRTFGKPEVQLIAEAQQIILRYVDKIQVVLAFGEQETQLPEVEGECILHSGVYDEGERKELAKITSMPPFSAGVWRKP